MTQLREPQPQPRPRSAMILAAGLGTRMRPLTADTAKPMLALQGRPLLDHALDRLAEAGVEQVVVNTHWQAEKVEAHLKARPTGPRIVVQREEMLLNTGGAVAAALSAGLLGEAPFFVVNGDAFWLDGPTLALTRLAGAMAIEGADAVLLLHRGAQVVSDVGAGDFAVDEWGVPRRPHENEQVPYVFAGVQVLSPRLFEGAPPAPFSMNVLWDRAIAAGRLRAIVHDGIWFHLSTPPDLARAEADLRERVSGDTR
ncbi:nucleotidyltransferase family protein [Acidisoma sp.]|uniref:nucleotidyltransferase family protein n=1 Tax=Acidisoma sp. TaxID=1872115 RepID=UPI003AFF9132